MKLRCACQSTLLVRSCYAVCVRHLAVAILFAWIFVGCKPDGDGPPTTRTLSSEIPTLAERIALLNRYVTFRRNYESLDFDITYLKNGGRLPGPSEWDLRLVAIVPEAELQAWVPSGVAFSPSAEVEFLKTVPTTIDYSTIREWYVDQHHVVGLDRAKRVVVYYKSSVKVPS